MVAVGLKWLEKHIAESAADERMKWMAGDWAAGVFNSFGGTHMENVWMHVSPAQIAAKANKEGVYSHELKPLASTYIQSLGWMRDERIDWLLADALCYGEVAGTWSHAGAMWWMRDGKVDWPVLLLKMAWGLFKWTIWIAMAVILYNASGLALGAWLAITGWVQLTRWRTREKKRRLLTAMLDAYNSLDSTSLSWTVVWEALRKARDLGAVWPPELYRLVEDRMPQRTTPAAPR